MDEQVTWKGQSFTLLVFGGIVFLCSIFFVLGMLVGRGQGKGAAESTKETAAAKSGETAALPAALSKEDKPTNSAYESNAVGKAANKETKPSDAKESEPVPARPTSDKPAQDKTVKASPKTAQAAPPAPPAPPAAPPKGAAAKTATGSPVKMIYLQVNAVATDTAAKKQVAELQKAGFTSMIVGGNGANSLYKVQVGPFATAADADIAKRKLEALGYKPIRK